MRSTCSSELILCHSSAQTWSWCAQALTQPSVTQRYWIWNENTTMKLLKQLQYCWIFFCILFIVCVLNAQSVASLFRYIVSVFRVKCVPAQTSLPTSLTSSWTLQEGDCVLCWRSVNLYYLLQISRPRQLSCLFCCEFYPLCFFLCYFSSYYPSVKALCRHVGGSLGCKSLLLCECFPGRIQLDITSPVCVSDCSNFAWRSCASTYKPRWSLSKVCLEKFTHQTIDLSVCVFNCSECICLFFFSVHLSPFTVSDQLINSTGPL